MNTFAIVTPMYNASETLQQFLASLVAQSYRRWKLMLIDDVSDESHWQKSAAIVNSWSTVLPKESSITLLRNKSKKWEVANVLCGLSLCHDDDIVCRIDADDWLITTDAFLILNKIYSNFSSGNEAIWTGHRWGYSNRNISGPIDKTADVYTHPWVSSHLKTFRKRLINSVPYDNFTNMNGDLVRRAGDQAIYLPVLHRAGIRGYLPDVFYHYSIDERGGAIYETADAKFQKAEADFIRSRGYVPGGRPWEECIDLADVCPQMTYEGKL